MLGVSELLAAIVPGARSHVIAVGDEVIDRTPGWVERAVIQNLGTSDKPFLIANILVVSALLGAVLGILAARRFVVGAAGIALMAAVGTAASFRDPQTDGAGAALGRARRRGGGHRDALAAAARGAGDLGRAQSGRRGATVDRRRFLGLAGAAVLVAGLGALGGRLLADSDRVDEIRKTIRLPRPVPSGAAGSARRAPPGSRAHARSSSRTATSTASTPRWSCRRSTRTRWSLQVKGRVDHPLQLHATPS